MAEPTKVEFFVGDDGSEQPVEVDLHFDRIMCPRHGEPFRSKWPTGFPEFTTAAFEELSKNETFMEYVGRNAALIHATLDHSPICERISKPSLVSAYLASGIGIERRCHLCQKLALGTPYQTQTGKFDHMCFQCVVYGLAPLH